MCADVKVEFDLQALRTVAGRFGLRNIVILDSLQQGKRILRTGRDTGISRKAFLEASGARYILKEFPFYANDLGFAEDITRYQRLLKDRFELPIPRYLPLEEHPEKFCTVIRNSNQSIFTVQQIANGGPPHERLCAATSAAKRLGMLHTASYLLGQEGIKYEVPEEAIFTTTSKLLERGKLDILNFFQLSSGHISLLENLVVQYKIYTEKNELEAEEWGYTGGKILVHGDYHINNLLFDDRHNVTAVLDFDDAKYDHPIHDVARLANSIGLFDFISSPEKPFFQVPDKINIELINIILESYLGEFSAGKDIVRGVLCPAIKCLAIQVAFIGLLSGGYKFNQIDKLLEFPNFLDESISNSLIGRKYG